MSDSIHRIILGTGLQQGFQMSQDAEFILKSVINDLRQSDYPGLTGDAYFEIFAAQQVLKRSRFNLDADEIESGIVGGDGDGGVDGFYVFVNRKFIREDTDTTLFKDQQLTVDLVVVQGKHKASFEESVPTKLKDFVEHCLRLNAPMTADLKKLYSSELLTMVGKFHEVYRLALSHRPMLRITFFHVTLGEQIDEKVKVRGNLLVDKAKEAFPLAECSYEPVTGTTLLELFHQQPEAKLALETPKYFDWKSFGKNAYVCVVTLPSFYKFIADDGVLREHIFDANVRDHAPEVKVNKGIRATLAAPQNDDFWWLNNGVTILASRVFYDNGALQITDPLVVNGLQTSYVVFNHFKDGGSQDDSRTLMVKVIENTDADTSDRIINATNSQTKIETINLHATEPIHRNIETALKQVDLFYDRRKNFYRNKGKPASKIITISYMAQAVASVALQQPDNARARPTTLAEKSYEFLFSEEYPLALYQKSAQIMKRVQAFLDAKGLLPGYKSNISFYMAMFATAMALKSIKPQRPKIAQLDMSKITDALLEDCHKWLSKEFGRLGGDDKVAKGPDLLIALKLEIRKRLAKGKAKA